MASLLVPCGHCNCHAKSTDATCPSCGEPLRRSDGSVPRSAVAVLLGLTAAGALAGSCSSSGPVVYYGPAPTTTSSGAGGAGGTGGTSASSSSSGLQVFYGPAPTTTGTGAGGASATSSSSGAGGSGGDAGSKM
jgi:hypothetical protein